MMENRIQDLAIAQGKTEEKLKGVEGKFKNVYAELNRFKDDVKEDFTKMEKTLKENIKDLRTDMNSEFNSVWGAIEKQRSVINGMLWKIFGIVTIPMILLIAATLVSAFKKGN